METMTDTVPVRGISKKRNNRVDSQRRKPDKTENQNCACSDEVDTICNYNMEHPRRGCAIIINNKNFENMEQRNGTEVDAHSLKTTLDKLAFDVDEHTDLSKDDMVDIIKTISQTDHRDCDCLVIAILSHGDDGIVHGTDGESVAIESLTEYFHGDRCPSLVGKPKLFFIQSCRGHKSDDGVPFESDGSEVPDSCTKHQQRIPRTADILVFYSTVQGYYSWRDPVHGSWFIQSLSHVLQKYSQTRSMQDMLTIVTNRVASLYETSNKQKKYDKKKQVPSMITTLTKRLYFHQKRGVMWQLFVKDLNNKTTVIDITKDATIDELMDKISKAVGIHCEELLVICGTKQLAYGLGEHLSDYNIQNESTLIVVMRLKGG